MSEQKNELAPLKSAQEQALVAHLQKRADTSGKQVEQKRRELASLAFTVEGLTQELLGENCPAPTSPEYQKLANTANLYSMLAMIRGMELMVDVLTVRRSVKIKGTKERGYTRDTVGQMVADVGFCLSNPHATEDLPPGVMVAAAHMVEQFENGLEMLNDIGNHFKAFKDKHGAVSETKYFNPEDEKEKPKAAAEEEVDENEALTESDAEKIERPATAEVMDKLKGKKK